MTPEELRIEVMSAYADLAAEAERTGEPYSSAEMADAAIRVVLEAAINDLNDFAGVSGDEEATVQVAKYFISRLETLLPQDKDTGS